jgi:REP element-mobilizing transposase RayT
MLTYTTYGKWLRGDARRWVSKGAVFAANPALEATDRARLRYPPFAFARAQRAAAGELLGQAICALGARVFALCVGSWHVHLVIGPVQAPLADVVKRTKGSVRNGLGYRRAIWAAGYDKRFCFDRAALIARVQYVRRHNIEDGRPPEPWAFIRAPSFVPRFPSAP